MCVAALLSIQASVHRVTILDCTIDKLKPITCNRRTENHQRGDNHRDARNLAKHVRNIDIALRLTVLRRLAASGG